MQHGKGMANWLAVIEFQKCRRTVQSQVMMALLYQMKKKKNAETTSVNGTNWDYFLPNVVT